MSSICSKSEWQHGCATYGRWAAGPSYFTVVMSRAMYALCGVAAFAVAVLIVQGCLLESFYVPSSSMAPTLEVDDCIVVPKLAYGLHVPFVDQPVVMWSSPDRGQVVVFHREDDPTTETDESDRALVKRVIGLAGDTVTITGTQVFVNGAALNERYARWMHGGIQETASFTVPDGALFMLGDNRDESYDSRFWSDPFVPVARVLGPAAAVYWSAQRAL